MGAARRARSAIHSAFPNRCHSQPSAHAVASEPRNRASTMRGSPGNATAVATSTTGLIAGAASRNVSAAASGTPWPISRRATGTDAHSHPGSTRAAAPATGTAAAGRAGRARRSTAGDTNAAMTPESSTPNTRNGSACTQTATNTVAAVCRTGADSASVISGRASTAASSTAQNTCSDVTRGTVAVVTAGDVASPDRARGPERANSPCPCVLSHARADRAGRFGSTDRERNPPYGRTRRKVEPRRRVRSLGSTHVGRMDARDGELVVEWPRTIMDAPATGGAVQEFTYDALPARIVFGAGAARTRLAPEIERLGARRLLLVASARDAELVREIVAPLGSTVAATFTAVREHVPVATAEAARVAAAEARADAVLSIGGGSTTGAAKAVALTARIPIVAVPTTYAGSEVTAVWGLTEDGRKTTGTDPAVLPRVVVYDPELTASLPRDLAVASGFNALAHGVEAFWAPRRNPVSTAIAEDGIAAVAAGLRKDEPAALLRGAWLTATAFAAAGSGLHHKLCHVLGGDGTPACPDPRCRAPARAGVQRPRGAGRGGAGRAGPRRRGLGAGPAGARRRDGCAPGAARPGAARGAGGRRRGAHRARGARGQPRAGRGRGPAAAGARRVGRR